MFKVAIAKQPLFWTNDQDVSYIYKTFHQNPWDYPGDSSREENDWVVQRENKRTIDKSLHGKRVGDAPKQVQTTNEQGSVASRTKRHTSSSPIPKEVKTFTTMKMESERKQKIDKNNQRPNKKEQNKRKSRVTQLNPVRESTQRMVTQEMRASRIVPRRKGQKKEAVNNKPLSVSSNRDEFRNLAKTTTPGYSDQEALVSPMNGKVTKQVGKVKKLRPIIDMIRQEGVKDIPIKKRQRDKTGNQDVEEE